MSPKNLCGLGETEGFLTSQIFQTELQYIVVEEERKEILPNPPNSLLHHHFKFFSSSFQKLQHVCSAQNNPPLFIRLFACAAFVCLRLWICKLYHFFFYFCVCVCAFPGFAR